MSYNIINALQRLGAKFQEKDADENGWINTYSLLRNEQNPSFGLNLKSGSFIDHGTGQKGSIIDLVVLVKKVSPAEAYEFVNGKGTSKGISISKSDSFWTNERKKWLKESQQRLKNSPESEIVATAKKADGLELDTLIMFGCGITDRYIKGEEREVLVIPYETGIQYYTRDEEGKLINMEKGSKPRESFFGKEQLRGLKNLIIAKSPREAMLYSQLLGDTYDAISISSGEVAKLFEFQRIYLKYLLKRYQKVYVSFDRDTFEAEQIAFGFARQVRDLNNDYGLDIELLNIGKLTGGTCKDFTDLLKSKYAKQAPELFKSGFKYSDYVWNTTTEENKIWHKDEKVNISLDPFRLVEVLGIHDFCKIYYQDVPIPIMVKIDDNILSEPSGYQLDQFVKDQLLGQYSKYIDGATTESGTKYASVSKLSRLYFKYAKELLKADYKVHLTKREVKFLSDSKDTAFLFYSGKVVKVTKKSVKEIKYSELDGAIWKSQIIDRPITLDISNGKDGVFAKFISNISNKDPKRIDSMESHIGYLLHTYKDPAKGKAIIFIDEKMGPKGSANGGTGKGIVAEAIGHIRKKAYIDGKIFDPNSRFAYQDIKLGDQFVHIDDIKEDLEFSYFFPAITNDLKVEPKGVTRMTIPFAYSPKFLMTTNYPIGGNSDSYKRRQSVVEFAPHYNKSFTPEEEFGHTLFNDWDEEEWNKFDNYMVHCLQVYLKKGLVEYDINYSKKQLSKSTNSYFVEWAEKHLELNVRYDLAELFRGNRMFPDLKDAKAPTNSKGIAFDSFLSKNGGILGASQARTFNNWVEQFGEFKGWKSKRRESDSRQLLIFNK
jgi:hypothetical protein